MTYRLKDSALQKHLDAISNGDFSHRLQNELQDIRGIGTTDADYRIFFGFMSGRAELVNRFSMLLYEHEIEAMPEYNPDGWNDFSEITPPKVGVYRVEVFSDGEHTEPCVRAAGYWDGKRWQVDDPQGGGYYYLMDGKIRFKSWE